MAFWNNVQSEPKMSFRWFASFGINNGEVKTYTLRSFQKPSFNIATSEYIWLNDVGFRPGVITWEPIEIVLTDGERRDANNTNKLVNILKNSGYQTNDENKPRSIIEKKKSSASLGNQLFFTQIDSDDNPIEEWVLINPFLQSVNFGQANYGADEIMSISLVIRYDYANYNEMSI
jgi:hypothetical protein